MKYVSLMSLAVVWSGSVVAAGLHDHVAGLRR